MLTTKYKIKIFNMLTNASEHIPYADIIICRQNICKKSNNVTITYQNQMKIGE